MFPNITAALDWLQTYFINGFLGGIFTFLRNLLVGFLQIFSFRA